MSQYYTNEDEESGGEADSATSLLMGKNSELSYSEEATMAEYISPKCVSFHNISYQVTQRSCFKKLPPKTILRNVR